jgi:hypothetical protein
MALTFTGKLGREATVEVSRPNPIMEDPERFQFFVKSYKMDTGQQTIETEISRAELEDLLCGLAQIHGNIDIRIWVQEEKTNG